MPVPDTILLATENAGKGRELAQVIRLLLGPQILVLTLRDLPNTVVLPEEIGGSFCEIAAAKALAAMNGSGLSSIGDDSGLCVDALGGGPGLKSRRWVDGVDDDRLRNEALVAAMSSFPLDRGAAFVSCVALCLAGDAPISAQGECRGTIRLVPSGENGFGYDPLFEPEGYGCTMAELSVEEKNAISHRALALRNLFVKLEWLGV